MLAVQWEACAGMISDKSDRVPVGFTVAPLAIQAEVGKVRVRVAAATAARYIGGYRSTIIVAAQARTCKAASCISCLRCISSSLFTTYCAFAIAVKSGIRLRIRKSANRYFPEDRAAWQLRWKHSGFSVYRGPVVRPSEQEGLERIAQYIIRSPFSLEKMQHIPA